MKVTFLQAIFFAAVLTLGCQSRSSQEPKDYPDALLVLPGASKVAYEKVNRTDQVSYKLKTDYPAAGTVDAILQHAGAKGWTPLKESYLNPGTPTSLARGWVTHESALQQPDGVVHSWKMEWQNRDKDILAYILTFRNSRDAKPELSSLSIVAVYVPAAVAGTMHQASLEVLRKQRK